MLANEQKSGPRVALLGFHLESNAFAPVSTEAHFRSLCYAEGEEITREARKSPSPLPAEMPAFYGEMFPARVRLSGMAIGTQIGFAIGGFSPTIAAAVAGDGPSGWVPVAVLGAVLCLLAAGAALTARETAHITLTDLERPMRTGTAAPVPA